MSYIKLEDRDEETTSNSEVLMETELKQLLYRLQTQRSNTKLWWWGYMRRGKATDFIFLGFKIIADGDCSHEIKRHLLLGRKAMKNLDRVFKSRDITLPTKVRLVKAMVFPVAMFEVRVEL